MKALFGLLWVAALCAQVPRPGPIAGGGGGGGSVPNPLILTGSTGQYNEQCGTPASVTTPASGTATIFCDSTNSNIETAMYSDRSLVQLAQLQSNNVVIGTANPAPLNPGGTFTSPIYVDVTSSGTNNVYMQLTGTFTETTALGSAFTFYDNTTLNVSAGQILTYQGFFLFPTINEAVDGNLLVGMVVNPEVTGPYTSSEVIFSAGSQLFAINSNDGGSFTTLVSVQANLDFWGVCTFCVGVQVVVEPGASTSTDMDLFETQIIGDSASTVTNFRQIHLEDPSSMGTLTNNWGIYEDPGVGANLLTSATFTVAAPTVAASQIGIGSTVTANTSCGTLAGSAGCWTINVAGTTRHIPYY